MCRGILTLLIFTPPTPSSQFVRTDQISVIGEAVASLPCVGISDAPPPGQDDAPPDEEGQDEAEADPEEQVRKQQYMQYVPVLIRRRARQETQLEICQGVCAHYHAWP